MPRYFFNLLHHPDGPDTQGSEFSDIHAAREAAVRLCGEMIAEIDGTFWDARLWQLEVADHERKRLFTLTFSAEEA